MEHLLKLTENISIFGGDAHSLKNRYPESKFCTGLQVIRQLFLFHVARDRAVTSAAIGIPYVVLVLDVFLIHVVVSLDHAFLVQYHLPIFLQSLSQK